jgi:hypothetical protein
MSALEHNQQALHSALASLRARLEGNPLPPEVDDPPQLSLLCTTFGLSRFERDILLLCAGLELDSSLAPLCASVQGNANQDYPTFSLALGRFAEPHWSALNPAAPLRYWRLIEVGNQPTQPITTSRLRIDERILHFLTGVHYLDERLAGLVHRVAPGPEEVPSHARLADSIAAAWAASPEDMPLLQLCGLDETSRRSIAAAACRLTRLELYSLAADCIPSGAAEMTGLLRLWEREAALRPAALYIDADGIERSDSRSASSLTSFLEQMRSPMFLSVRDRWRTLQRSVKTFDIPKPTTEEQGMVWKQLLDKAGAEVNGYAAHMASHFSLTPAAIQASVRDALESAGRGEALETALWDAGRSRSRPRLEDLAQRIDGAATWDELVLPPKEKCLLSTICTHVKHRAQVYGAWGFGVAGRRGLGISALFAGVSGTGKTMAAEVLANELRLDLYRIDLSSVVSKYIGETEKNLRRVFDAAEEGGAILFFDEADALFGKRSEVKDSHDRYANIEINYLLQRMESYRGLAVLATNMRSALDPAFLRRIRFVVNFPFPEPQQRAEIWQRVFPAATPVKELDIHRLARLSIAGGNIRNIALNAAFLAASEGGLVSMAHLASAARDEFVKMERPVPESELGSWT